MTVFFDKENITFYLEKVDETDLGKDTLRMLKNQLSVHLNFKIDELNEYEFILFEEFQDGVSRDFKLTHGNNKVTRPLKKDAFPSASGVYLLSDEKINTAKSFKTHLIGAVGEEIEVLNSLIINADYSFHKLKEIGVDITPTNHLDIFDMPFSTIVVVDRYMFKGPEIGGNVSLFDYNLHPMLVKMFSNKLGSSKIIFIYQVTPTPRRAEDRDTGPNLENMSKRIKGIVDKLCPNPEIYFIGMPAGLIDDEHDRYILSDYINLKSGGSFVFFKSTGAIATASLLVDCYSLAYREYNAKATKIIQKLNTIVNEVLTITPAYSKVPKGTVSTSVINFN